MASTRNKNTAGDYALEQKAYDEQLLYRSYIRYGVPESPFFAGHSLLPGKMASRDLANNYCDIESQLRGIGSTNLVQPQSEVAPQLKNIQSLNMVPAPQPVSMPDPLVIEPNQRLLRR
jgi:hypothetical protein